MAVTQNLKEALNIKVSPHAGQQDFERLSNGLLKADAHTVLVPPSMMHDPASKSGGGLVQEALPGFDRPLPPPQEAQTPQKRKGRKQTVKAAESAPEQKPPVVLEVTIPGLGDIPSQYAHCYVGEGVVVLGLTSLSYRPKRCVRDESGKLSGAVELSCDRGSEYVFLGQQFTDGQGVKNLILIKLPKEATQNDGEEL